MQQGYCSNVACCLSSLEMHFQNFVSYTFFQSTCRQIADITV